ncbi:angiopoietin-related protein 7-like [Ylistrum balloti]|uniref:angiopoietin-related protein 7-like n=1 Tax=Ylistrum balloti TaxID=509963 RepID=UPI0029059DAA|nr:angiopoietin-related protein 7-like [Ylistrum balloti]
MTFPCTGFLYFSTCLAQSAEFQQTSVLPIVGQFLNRQHFKNPPLLQQGHQVIQNRQNDEVDFYRNWSDYKTGFGDLRGNFWLGNEHIVSLTGTPSMLRLQLESLNGTSGYAEYSVFQISSEKDNYRLSVDGFTGNISDSFTWNSGQQFSTFDRDNDKDADYNCAVGRGGSWWYRQCTRANLNGMYKPPKWRRGIYWEGFYQQTDRTLMKTTKMLVKKP